MAAMITEFERTYNCEAEKEKNVIGKKIAEARKLKKISIPEFTRRLNRYGVKCGVNAVNKWELGYSVPTAYQLIAVCLVLDIDEGLSYFCSDLKPLLNGIGREKLEEYRELLIASGKYAPEDEEYISPEKIRELFMPLEIEYTKLAAGAGKEDTGLPPSLRFVRRTKRNRGANCIAVVDGPSMEPEFYSGDMVYVKYTNTVSPGDIAVAWWTGGMVIKQVGPDRKLHSINKAYPFGDKSEDDHVRVIGKVMGKVEEGELPSERELLLINDAFSEEISAFNRQYAD